MNRETGFEEQRHPLVRRVAHWGMALAIIVMIGSGWRIYNNSPLLPFHFPVCMTIGGTPAISYALHNESGLASALQWHFAGMWLLAACFLLYVIHGATTGHFRRDFVPVGPGAILRDLFAAATFRLGHRLGEYNAVQKVFYLGVLFAVAVMLASGLAIWKPVQLGWLSWFFCGYDIARIVHFCFMALIVGFIVVHVALVLLVPKTFVAMTLGHARARRHASAS
jgi:thiosulfate reductase cytochrome b subunit